MAITTCRVGCSFRNKSLGLKVSKNPVVKASRPEVRGGRWSIMRRSACLDLAPGDENIVCIGADDKSWSLTVSDGALKCILFKLCGSQRLQRRSQSQDSTYTRVTSPGCVKLPLWWNQTTAKKKKNGHGALGKTFLLMFYSTRRKWHYDLTNT